MNTPKLYIGTTQASVNLTEAQKQAWESLKQERYNQTVKPSKLSPEFGHFEDFHISRFHHISTIFTPILERAKDLNLGPTASAGFALSKKIFFDFDLDRVESETKKPGVIIDQFFFETIIIPRFSIFEPTTTTEDFGVYYSRLIAYLFHLSQERFLLTLNQYNMPRCVCITGVKFAFDANKSLEDPQVGQDFRNKTKGLFEGPPVDKVLLFFRIEKSKDVKGYGLVIIEFSRKGRKVSISYDCHIPGDLREGSTALLFAKPQSIAHDSQLEIPLHIWICKLIKEMLISTYGNDDITIVSNSVVSVKKVKAAKLKGLKIVDFMDLMTITTYEYMLKDLFFLFVLCDVVEFETLNRTNFRVYEKFVLAQRNRYLDCFTVTKRLEKPFDMDKINKNHLNALKNGYDNTVEDLNRVTLGLHRERIELLKKHKLYYARAITLLLRLLPNERHSAAEFPQELITYTQDYKSRIEEAQREIENQKSSKSDPETQKKALELLSSLLKQITQTIDSYKKIQEGKFTLVSQNELPQNELPQIIQTGEIPLSEFSRKNFDHYWTSDKELSVFFDPRASSTETHTTQSTTLKITCEAWQLDKFYTMALRAYAQLILGAFLQTIPVSYLQIRVDWADYQLNKASKPNEPAAREVLDDLLEARTTIQDHGARIKKHWQNQNLLAKQYPAVALSNQVSNLITTEESGEEFSEIEDDYWSQSSSENEF